MQIGIRDRVLGSLEDVPLSPSSRVKVKEKSGNIREIDYAALFLQI
jgi:hypothetical protein